MKTNKLLILFVFVTLSTFTFAQQLLTENFNYTNGQPLTSNNWVLASGGTSPNVSSPGLTYTGYVLSGQGNAALVNTVGQAVCTDGLSNINSGSLYTSFMLNVSSVTATGDYLFSLLPQGATGLGTSFGRVFAKAASTGYYKLGVAQFNSAVYNNNDSFAIGTTVLVVTKYKFGGTGNDSCSVFGFSSGIPSTEPLTPGAINTNSIASPPTGLGRYVIRMATNSPSYTIDGIRSGQTWTDLNTVASVPQSGVSSPSINALGSSYANITWTKPAGYLGTAMTTLVFLKAGSAITTGTPNAPASTYTANTNFLSATSTFQNDANAKCVYKDTNNAVTVSGLTQGQTYYALIYVLRNADTVYSSSVTVNNTIPVTAPGALTGMIFTATGQTTASISWTKPAGYNNANHSTVIFVKALSAVTQGTPVIATNKYLANSNFTLSTSTFQNDASAKCVFNGDTNFVNVTGLTSGTIYYVLAYAANDADSSYAAAATASGKTNSPAPQAVTAVTFTASGATTANITWNKGINYINSSFTTLVFVKQAAPVTAGTPTAGVTVYTDNASFGLGTPYQNDASAYCVYKGDTNVVSLTSLTASTNYAVLIYVVRDIDSLYTTGATGAGTTSAAPVAPPADVTGVNFTTVTSTSGNISWTLPTGFSTITNRVLVFAKTASAITAGTPTRRANFYTANANSPYGTAYQNDALAKCVYSGTGTNVTIGGLNGSNVYYFLIYVIRTQTTGLPPTQDSTYSTPGATTTGTITPPADVTNLTFGATSTTTATISWTKPVGYNNATYSTLVFVEQGGVVYKGTPTTAPIYYSANANFAGTGSTAYQNDGSAFCVYKGDTNFVNVTGLNNAAPYYVLVFSVRDADSAYSLLGVTTSGSVLASPPPAPVDVTATTVNGLTSTSARINWTKPTGYINSVYTTLVFVKKNLSISKGTPTKTVSYYTANTNISLGTAYQNDNLARCVYKGDTNLIDITNLNYPANYYVLVYVVRDVDSVYSASGDTSSGTALAPPPPPSDASGTLFTGLTQTNARVDWTKPPGYSNASYTTLVFVKKNLAITKGTPTTSVTAYTANQNVSLGSAYQNDNLARCIYKGDSSFVNITGLNYPANYYVLVWVVRDIDSVYSPAGDTASGSPLTPPPPPSDVTNVTFTGISTTAANISWTKPSNYTDATLTTLVFVKQTSAVSAGIPTKSQQTYLANSSFGLGTSYQNDPAARCVYKGDSSFVNITNINNTSTYYVMIYVIHNVDSLYSANGATTSGMALPNPPPPPSDVTNLTFTGLSTTAAKIQWTKPLTYNNNVLSTLVFVKSASTINKGTPTKSVNAYSPNVYFGTGSAYQNDANTFCVYKGDTNFVNIGNLFNGAPYYVLVYVVTDYDSLYSVSGDTASGWALPTPPPPPYYTISQINHTNTLTGVPDSIGVRVGLRGVVYGFNLRTPGVEFLLRDKTGGITISNLSSSFGYTVKEGDSIEVQGTIGTSRGLLTLSGLDTLKVIGSGKQLKTPTPILKPNESTENDYVQISYLQFLNTPISFVLLTGTYRCLRLGSTDTINLIVTGNLPGAGLTFYTPSAYMVKGYVRQNSTSTVAPFAFDGYNVLCFEITMYDIFSTFAQVAPANNASINTQGNLTKVNTFNWTKCALNIASDTVKYTFQLDTINGNFTNPRYSTIVSDTFLGLTNATINSIVGTSGMTFNGRWRVIASAKGVAPNTRNSDSIYNISLTVGAQTGVSEIQVAHQPTIFPNPTNGILNIISQMPITTICVMDITGRILIEENPSTTNYQTDISGLHNGIYLVRIQTESGTIVKRLLKQ